MTWLGGSDVSLLGLVEIPSFVDMDFILYQKHLKIHYYSAIILTSFFTVHIFAALFAVSIEFSVGTLPVMS